MNSSLLLWDWINFALFFGCIIAFWNRYTGLGSQTQTPKLSKVLISGVSFHHRSLSQSHERDVLSYSECKIANIFWGFASKRHWGGLTVTPDSPAAQRFFSLLHSSKNRYTQNIAGYGTALSVVWFWQCEQSHLQYSLQLTETLKGGHLWLEDNFFFTGWTLVKVS